MMVVEAEPKSNYEIPESAQRKEIKKDKRIAANP